MCCGTQFEYSSARNQLSKKKITIKKQITIKKTKKIGFIFSSLFLLVADLKFGNIAAGPSAGIVEISTDDMRTSNGGVTFIAAGNVSNAASLDITGYPNATFTISLPQNIYLTSGSDQMEVNNFVSDLGDTSTF